jgi:putative sterol carrier protein
MPSGGHKPGTAVIGRKAVRSGKTGLIEKASPEVVATEAGAPEAGVKDVIPAFFKEIAGPHPAVPKTISGSLRFDLEDGNRSEHWRVTFTKGEISTARSNTVADCIARTDKATLEAIILGRVNAMAAILRGAIKVEGQVLLLALFRSLLIGTAAKPKSQRVGKNTGRR